MTFDLGGALPHDTLPIAQTTLGEIACELAATMPPMPFPGQGQTLARWQALADIAAHDVCLAKVLEAHFDAHAILYELAHQVVVPDALWAVWAAEPPDAVVELDNDGGDHARVRGEKAWCSGADVVSDALMTVIEDGARNLVHVRVHQEGISPPALEWNATGMSRVVSGRLRFTDVPVTVIGMPGAYLDRPGFWHGGAGIAACWFGAATAIADTLRTHPRAGRPGHARTHLGAVDVALGACVALLRQLAARIDAMPLKSHANDVIRLRSTVERACVEVVDRVARALGPGPLCNDRAHGLRCADLVVFIRQSHAESDWDTIGEVAVQGGMPWRLI